MRLLINTASMFKGGGLQAAKPFLEECKNFIEFDYFIALGVSIGCMIIIFI